MTRSRPRFLALLMLLGPLLVAGSCKHDDGAGTDTAADVRADVGPEAAGDDTADVRTEVGSEAAVDTAADVATCDAGLLTGVWLSARYSVSFDADLSYQAAGAPNLAHIDVTGQAVVDSCRISFTNESGAFACPTDKVGIYTFAVGATSLSLTLVADPCDGRRIPLDGVVLARE